MARTNNPTLGTITCDACGGLVDVCQTQRGKGRLLYTRCASCGTDQRTGKAVQTKWYYQTKWREGVEVVRPANVEERTETTEQNLEPVQVLPVSEKTVEPVSEPNEEPETEPKGKGFFGLALAAVVTVLILPIKLGG